MSNRAQRRDKTEQTRMTLKVDGKEYPFEPMASTSRIGSSCSTSRG